MTQIHEYVADAFVAEGVDTVFALMGDANMLWLDNMAARSSVRVVHARHEAASLAMADGWAQSSGEVGICSVTCGPGLTNLVTSLRVAADHRTPIVVLAGDTPVTSAVHLQAFDVGALRVLAGVEVLEVRSGSDVAAKVHAAFATARRDLRPVVLSLPYDLAEEECHQPPYVPSRRPAAPAPARTHEVEAVRARLADADQVLLVIGRGAVASGSLDLVEQLADHLGAVTGTTVKAVGALHHRADDLGVVGGFSSPEVRERIAGCDVVLSLGASLSWFTTLDGALITTPRTIQVVDRDDAWNPDYTFDPDLRVVADCRVFVEQLLEALRPDGSRAEPGTRRPAPSALPSGADYYGVADDAADDGLDPVSVLAAVRRTLTEPVQLVLGAGHFWNLIVEMPEPFDPRRMQMHHGFGSIAQAMPAGIGAAVAETDLPTIVVEGDGSLMMHIQELETAARSGIAMLVLIMDDAAYGAEFHKLAAHGMHPEESVFGFVDFAGVAEAFGARARTPGSLADVVKDVEEFLGDPVLTVVDVRITRRVVSSRHRANYAAQREERTVVARH